MKNFFIKLKKVDIFALGPPRFIWKDKPVIVPSGNELGQRLGLVSPDDKSTGIGPTVVGDWYMNFGLAGVIGGMFLLGAAFRLIYEYFVGATASSLSGIMIYSITWIQLIIRGMENWIVPIWAGVVKTFIIILIVHLALTHKNHEPR